MLKIATQAHAFGKDIQCGLCGLRMLIVERHFIVYPVADGLHAAPAGFDVSKEFKRDGRKTIHLAVAAVEQEAEHFVRQIADGGLARRPIELIRNSAVSNPAIPAG